MEDRRATTLFAFTAFASAFLLFQVQPMVGRAILPWFGGSAAVWTTCVLFFQLILFAGYAAAHLSASFLPPRVQRVVHVLLLAIGLVFLPVLPDAAWREHDPARPVAHILTLLAASLGPTLLVLSMTGPVLQAWFARLRPHASPYPLYAMSNAGSLLGLLAYPFLIEPSIGVQAQGRLWSVGYAVFALGCAACAWWALGAPVRTTHAVSAEPARTPLFSVLLWTALSACGSMLLLSVTNQICLNVASVPFLWVVPLALYLLSFILTFGGARGYPRAPALLATVPALAGVALLLLGRFEVPGFGIVVPPLPWLVGIYCFALFVLCLVCHGELHRLRPAPERLTAFYLSIAGGGAMGGVAIGVVTPLWLFLHQELAFAVLFFCVTVLACLYRDPASGLARGRPRWAWAVLVVWVALLALFFHDRSTRMLAGTLSIERNFYGTTRVYESGERRLLVHGTTRHGYQDLSSVERRSEPTSYFARGSGIGATLDWLAERRAALRVGIVGLGTGTLAAYCRPGDSYRFYDIDPAVIDAADRWFRYLPDARERGCDVSIVPGDARLSLEQELAAQGSQEFDVLVLDAFSSDAIPVHLLTAEAFDLYRSHLGPGGLLAIHVTNTYLDLPRVVFALADALDLDAIHLARLVVSTHETKSDWVIVAPREGMPSGPTFVGARRSIEHDRRHRWSDDFSNLLSVLK